MTSLGSFTLRVSPLSFGLCSVSCAWQAGVPTKEAEASQPYMQNTK